MKILITGGAGFIGSNLAKKISHLRNAKYEYGEPNYGDSKRRVPDISMNEELDWLASTTLEEGLSQLL